MKTILSCLCGLALSTAATAQTGTGRTEASKLHPATIEGTTQLGVKLGMTKVEQLGDAVATYGAFADHALAENFLVGGAVDYWSKSTGTIAETSAQVSDLAAAIDGKYIFTGTKTSFRPYVVAGVAVHRFAITESKASSSGEVDRVKAKYKDVEGEFGLDYGGGAVYRVQKAMDVVGEVRYRSIMDPGVSLSQLAFTGGLSYLL